MKGPVNDLPREIRYIVIHCSACRCNESAPAKQPGQPAGKPAGAVFHLRIGRDGRVVRQLPFFLPGNHTPGFNRNSIGICWEGGRDPSGRPADTRTWAQKDALEDVIEMLKKLYRDARILGHDRLTSCELPDCPGFDVCREYGKGN